MTEPFRVAQNNRDNKAPKDLPQLANAVRLLAPIVPSILGLASGASGKVRSGRLIRAEAGHTDNQRSPGRVRGGSSSVSIGLGAGSLLVG